MIFSSFFFFFPTNNTRQLGKLEFEYQPLSRPNSQLAHLQWLRYQNTQTTPTTRITRGDNGDNYSSASATITRDIRTNFGQKP